MTGVPLSDWGAIAIGLVDFISVGKWKRLLSGAFKHFLWSVYHLELMPKKGSGIFIQSFYNFFRFFKIHFIIFKNKFDNGEQD